VLGCSKSLSPAETPSEITRELKPGLGEDPQSTTTSRAMLGQCFVLERNPENFPSISLAAIPNTWPVQQRRAAYGAQSASYSTWRSCEEKPATTMFQNLKSSCWGGHLARVHSCHAPPHTTEMPVHQNVPRVAPRDTRWPIASPRMAAPFSTSTSCHGIRCTCFQINFLFSIPH
jgi:hypothetical protein